MQYKLTFFIFILFSYNMVFSSTQTGTVTDILVRDDGLHLIYLSGDRSTEPTCVKAHGFRYWMIKDENNIYGKSQFSMLLSAYLSNKKVIIRGSHICSRWGDGEDIRSVQLTQ
jgi:hypothetical protein